MGYTARPHTRAYSGHPGARNRGMKAAAVSRHYTRLTTEDKCAAIQRLPEGDKGLVNDGDG
jgi:hypothetical protein